MVETHHRPGVVVVGSDFRALGVVRSLGRRRIPCIVIDNLPRSAWFSRYTKKRIRWHGPLESEEFLRFLLSLAREQHLEQWVLMPMPDDAVELIARHSEELSTCYRLVTQDWTIVQWANDKSQTYRLAEELGVPYPMTWYPRHEDELASLDIQFPVIIKPAISLRLQHALRLKALPASNLEELRAHYRLATSVMEPEHILIQEIIPGDGRSQYSVAAYCKEGRVLASMTARRTRQYPIDYGLGSSFVEAIEVPVISELARRLLERMQVSGMLEVEFKHDRRDGKYKLLDINLRPWGWHTLSLACGLDFPWIQYADLLGELPPIPAPRYGAHWVRLITDLPAGLQERRAGITTTGAYLRSLLGKTVFSVFDWRDPLPVFGDFGSALIRALTSKKARTKHAGSQPQMDQPERQGRIAVSEIVHEKSVSL
jgi:D-aspartate ligase